MVQHRYWSSSCGGEENGRFLGMIIGSNELFFFVFQFFFPVKQLDLWWDETWGRETVFKLTSAIVESGKEWHAKNDMNGMIWEEWYGRNDMT